MADKYKGSIAQKNVQFPIETVIVPLSGENYTRVMIFMPLSKATTYLAGITSPAAGSLYEMTSSNYGSMTSGLLLTWLNAFFENASASKVGIAVYDDGTEATQTLAVVYESLKMWAYFKFAITDAAGYSALQVSLATLCIPDALYSDCWIGTSDSNVLTSTSTLISSLNNAGANARVVYNPSTTINPALAQLGKTLSSPNSSGVCVGNDVDMVAFASIGASGAADSEGNPTNLLPAQITALDNQKIGYQTYVGDGTSNVVTEGSLTLKGESVGANWLKHYIEYMCKTQAATLISSMNQFRNNATYQQILLILADQVNAFVQLGRLAGFKITAPVFADLPQSGDTFTVPNAWNATYVDSVREVVVYGTLYINQPTR